MSLLRLPDALVPRILGHLSYEEAVGALAAGSAIRRHAAETTWAGLALRGPPALRAAFERAAASGELGRFRRATIPATDATDDAVRLARALAGRVEAADLVARVSGGAPLLRAAAAIEAAGLRVETVRARIGGDLGASALDGSPPCRASRVSLVVLGAVSRGARIERAFPAARALRVAARGGTLVLAEPGADLEELEVVALRAEATAFAASFLEARRLEVSIASVPRGLRTLRLESCHPDAETLARVATAEPGPRDLDCGFADLRGLAPGWFRGVGRLALAAMASDAAGRDDALRAALGNALEVDATLVFRAETRLAREAARHAAAWARALPPGRARLTLSAADALGPGVQLDDGTALAVVRALPGAPPPPGLEVVLPVDGEALAASGALRSAYNRIARAAGALGAAGARLLFDVYASAGVDLGWFEDDAVRTSGGVASVGGRAESALRPPGPVAAAAGETLRAVREAVRG